MFKADLRSPSNEESGCRWATPGGCHEDKHFVHRKPNWGQSQLAWVYDAIPEPLLVGGTCPW